MKRFLVATAAACMWPLLTAGSCATTQGPDAKIVTQVVKEPVPVPCTPQLTPDPVYPDSDDALASVTDVFQGVQLLKAGRALRIARLSELGAALKACEGAQ